MRIPIRVRSFFNDDFAVSEEFTSLPTLSIVMIGFALFLVLLAQTYLTHGERMNQLDDYQTADRIVRKLTNPDCCFMRPGGLIDVSVLRQDTSMLQRMNEQYNHSGVRFLLRLRYDNIEEDFPSSNNLSAPYRIAVTRQAGIYLSDAQTVPGSLTIILWRDS